MDDPKPKRSADALRTSDRAPRARTPSKPYKPLSDARCRELYRQSLRGTRAASDETALFARLHREFIDDVFNGDVDLDAKYPELEGGES
jgi:hypothetical protein